jgi:hypothetical protein
VREREREFFYFRKQKHKRRQQRDERDSSHLLYLPSLFLVSEVEGKCTVLYYFSV